MGGSFTGLNLVDSIHLVDSLSLLDMLILCASLKIWDFPTVVLPPNATAGCSWPGLLAPKTSAGYDEEVNNERD